MQITFGHLRDPNGAVVLFDDTYPNGWPTAFNPSTGSGYDIILGCDYYPASVSTPCTRDFGAGNGVPYVVRKGTCFRVSGAEAGVLWQLGALVSN